MPYIQKKERIFLEPAISKMVAEINDLAHDNPTGLHGTLNYVITRLVLDTLPEKRYSHINNAVGALECAKLELYRRLAAPYEDLKATENGDVY